MRRRFSIWGESCGRLWGGLVGEVTQVERVLWCLFCYSLAAWAFLAGTGLLHLLTQGFAWDLPLAGGEGSAAHMLTCPAVVLVLLPALATLPR